MYIVPYVGNQNAIIEIFNHKKVTKYSKIKLRLLTKSTWNGDFRSVCRLKPELLELVPDTLIWGEQWADNSLLILNTCSFHPYKYDETYERNWYNDPRILTYFLLLRQYIFVACSSYFLCIVKIKTIILLSNIVLYPTVGQRPPPFSFRPLYCDFSHWIWLDHHILVSFTKTKNNYNNIISILTKIHVHSWICFPQIAQPPSSLLQSVQIISLSA